MTDPRPVPNSLPDADGARLAAGAVEVGVNPSDLSPLLRPITVGGVTLPNRVAFAPLTTMWATDLTLTPRHADYYETRAKAGIGLLITEQHTADRERTGFSRHIASALEPRSIPVLADIAERVHQHQAAIFVQLYGPGIADRIGIDINGLTPPLSPSGIASAWFGENPIAASGAELAAVVKSFAKAAKNVAAAGIDGVELHSARSELLGQFLSPLYNRRSDSYGGDPARRCRLALHIAEAIHEAAPGLALGIQISVDEYMGDAALTPETAAEQLHILAESRLFDIVDLSTGNEFSDHLTIPPMEHTGAPPTEAFAMRVRQTVEPYMRVLINGGVRDIATANRLVRDGIADIVAMTRPALADPDHFRKAVEGRSQEITPCVGSNDCLRLSMSQLPLACLMNPDAGREADSGLPVLAGAGPSVTVIGGGPAGMRAAITASERGFTTTLVEESDHLGGHLRQRARLPHRTRWYDAITWFERELERTGVEVITGVRVDQEARLPHEADIVLIATGAKWQRTGFSPALPLRESAPGTEQSNVLDVGTAIDLTENDAGCLGQRILIVDDAGSYEAVGLADRLSAGGADIEIITKNPQPGAQLVAALDHSALFKRLAAAGVRAHRGLLLDRIEGSQVCARDAWSGRLVEFGPVDTVVLAQGRSSDTSTARAFESSAARVQVIGDALAPRETRVVVAEAHRIAQRLT